MEQTEDSMGIVRAETGVRTRAVAPRGNVVDHPPHYTRGGIETIDAIEAWDLNFHLGNAVKYISRAGHKGDALEDLEKARWYLDREIARRKAVR